MKYHKIKDIPLEVCTAEAKIAYNLASTYTSEYKATYQKKAHLFPRIAVSDFIDEAVNKCLKMWVNGYTYQTTPHKYDIDAIQCCLNAGMEDFFKSEHSILSSYEEIGNIFKSYYL